MTPGTIFVSHRAEYGSLVKELKKAIETTSRGKIRGLHLRGIAGRRSTARSSSPSSLNFDDEAQALFSIWHRELEMSILSILARTASVPY